MCDEKTISKQFHSEEKKLKTNEIAKLFNFRMPFAESQLLLSQGNQIYCVFYYVNVKIYIKYVNVECGKAARLNFVNLPKYNNYQLKAIVFVMNE